MPRLPWSSGIPCQRARNPSASSQARLPAASAARRCERPGDGFPSRRRAGHTGPRSLRPALRRRGRQWPPKAGRRCPAAPWTSATHCCARRSPGLPAAKGSAHSDRLADESSSHGRRRAAGPPHRNGACARPPGIRRRPASRRVPARGASGRSAAHAIPPGGPVRPRWLRDIHCRSEGAGRRTPRTKRPGPAPDWARAPDRARDASRTVRAGSGARGAARPRPRRSS